MTKKFLFISFMLLFIFSGESKQLRAQTISRDVTPSCGGFASASNASLTWTLGEPFQQTLNSGNQMLTQGFQQPETDTVRIDLSLLIQGFYRGSGVLAASVDPITHPSLADTIVVEHGHGAGGESKSCNSWRCKSICYCASPSING